MLEIKKLQEDLRSESAAQVALCETVKSRGDDFTSEETQQFDARAERIDYLKKEIKKLERFEQAHSLTVASKPTESFSRSSGVNEYDRKLAFHAWALAQVGGSSDISPRMRDAAERCGFDLWSNTVQSFDQTAGTGTEGGNFLNGSLFQGVIERLKNFGGLLQHVNVINTPDGSPLHFVPMDDTSNKATVIDADDPANVNVANTSLTLGNKITLTEFDIATAVFPISRVLLRNTRFDLEGYVAQQIGTRLGRGINYYVTRGNGTTEPGGIVTETPARVYSGSTSAFDWKDLADLKYSIDPDYHDGSKFMMHSNTYNYLLTTSTTTTDQPFWFLGMNPANGGLRTIHGDEIILNNQMPEIGSGNKVVIYGNLKLGFTVRMIDSVKIVSSRELYWKSQALAVAGWAALDSAVTDSYALGALVTGTAP